MIEPRYYINVRGIANLQNFKKKFKTRLFSESCDISNMTVNTEYTVQTSKIKIAFNWITRIWVLPSTYSEMELEKQRSDVKCEY